MSAKTRIAALERQRGAGGAAADLETLRVLSALCDTDQRDDDATAAELRERLRHRPVPRPGGFLEALALFGAEWVKGVADGHD